MNLNSLSNAGVLLSLFWGHERLTDRSISKRYPKSDIALWVEKKVQLQERFTQDSFGHLKTLCISVFIASSGVWVWMKNATAHRKEIIKKKTKTKNKKQKTVAFEYEFSLKLAWYLKLVCFPCEYVNETVHESQWQTGMVSSKRQSVHLQGRTARKKCQIIHH